MRRVQTHPIHYPTDLTDEEWDYVKSLVPAPKSGKGKRGRPALERRPLVNGVFYIVRSGCAWRLLPTDFGPWQSIYGYYRQWTKDWTWRFIHDTLRDCVRKTEERKVAPTAAIVDSQTVKTADQAGERGYDAGKKLVGRKRHIAVDCMGLILAIMITPAAVQDRDAAKSLIQLLVAMYSRVQVIWADGGYLGSLVQWVKQLRPFGKLHLEIVLPRHFQWNDSSPKQPSPGLHLIKSPVFRADRPNLLEINHVCCYFHSTENVEEPRLCAAPTGQEVSRFCPRDGL